MYMKCNEEVRLGRILSFVFIAFLVQVPLTGTEQPEPTFVVDFPTQAVPENGDSLRIRVVRAGVELPVLEDHQTYRLQRNKRMCAIEMFGDRLRFVIQLDDTALYLEDYTLVGQIWVRGRDYWIAIPGTMLTDSIWKVEILDPLKV